MRVLYWLGLAGLGFVRAQTLYRLVVPTVTISGPPGVVTESEFATESISAAGVGADGMTTYVEEGLISAFVDLRSGTTFSFKPTSTPFTRTFEEDASRLRFGSSDGPGDIYGACTFEADGKGACVAMVPELTTTFTTTITGSAAPWTTLNAAAAITTTATLTSQTATPSPSPSGNNGARALPTEFTIVILPALFFFFSI
ncbi:hypothetical protein DFH09DRAFT_1463131 [Mycena vulgaris]|nr:hypothetical protein DFH09DRAFT_1463131 [Mycena vulgaris]